MFGPDPSAHRPENRLFCRALLKRKNTSPSRGETQDAPKLALKKDTGNNKTTCASCDRIHRVRIDRLCGADVLCCLLFGAVIRSMEPEEIGAEVVVLFRNVVAAVLVMTCRHMAHRALGR